METHNRYVAGSEKETAGREGKDIRTLFPQTCGYQGGGREWEVGRSRCKLLYIESPRAGPLLPEKGSGLGLSGEESRGSSYQASVLESQCFTVFQAGSQLAL